jgi:hypothetical protein
VQGVRDPARRLRDFVVRWHRRGLILGEHVRDGRAQMIPPVADPGVRAAAGSRDHRGERGWRLDSRAAVPNGSARSAPQDAQREHVRPAPAGDAGGNSRRAAVPPEWGSAGWVARPSAAARTCAAEGIPSSAPMSSTKPAGDALERADEPRLRGQHGVLTQMALRRASQRRVNVPTFAKDALLPGHRFGRSVTPI